MTPGGVIDATVVLSLVGFWFLCAPNCDERGIFDFAVPVSLSGVYVVARRLLSPSSPLPPGIGLWGAHGLVGIIAVGVFMAAQRPSDIPGAESIAQGVLAVCLAALIVQVLIGIVAASRLIHRRARGFGDVMGATICVAYGFVMSGWALLVFE
jgi:hypothetical protein